MELNGDSPVACNVRPSISWTGVDGVRAGLSLLALIVLTNCLSVQPEDVEPAAPARQQLRVLPAAPTIAVGASLQLRVTIEQPGVEIALPLSWSSGDTQVATVNAQGLVRGVDSGWAVITVRSYNGMVGSLEVEVR